MVVKLSLISGARVGPVSPIQGMLTYADDRPPQYTHNLQKSDSSQPPKQDCRKVDAGFRLKILRNQGNLSKFALVRQRKLA
jgi:hypothetical protein